MKEEFKNDIKRLSPRAIYEKYLLGSVVWYFRDHLKKAEPALFYDEFKHFVANHLNIPFANISIVGSAKTGFSLAPKKYLNNFHQEDSDFDLILVSPNLYRKFWDVYYELHFKGIFIDNYNNKTSEIFRRFISIKEPDPSHPFLKEWISKVESFNKDFQVRFDIYNVINYRIYESWESVEKYHIKGIRELKQDNIEL